MIESLLKTGMRLMPAPTGFALTKAMAARRPQTEVSPIEKQAVWLGKSMKVGPLGRIPAMVWGDGPTVAMVHGWGGRAAQMAPMAVHLAEQGFRCVAFDVAGHGASKDTELRWEWFVRDIADVAESFGPLHAFVGHSAGALAMMAARHLRGVSAEKYVCVSAPLFPYPPLRLIKQRLNPRESVLRRYQNYLASQLGTDWASLEAGSAWAGACADTLLCYDEKDRFVDPTDGERIKALCPGATLFKTSQYGHTRLLSAIEVTQSIGTFLSMQDGAASAQRSGFPEEDSPLCAAA